VTSKRWQRKKGEKETKRNGTKRKKKKEKKEKKETEIVLTLTGARNKLGVETALE